VDGNLVTKKTLTKRLGQYVTPEELQKKGFLQHKDLDKREERVKTAARDSVEALYVKKNDFLSEKQWDEYCDSPATSGNLTKIEAPMRR
jgi:hypothetical protein